MAETETFCFRLPISDLRILLISAVLSIDVTNEQSRVPIDVDRLRAAARAVLEGEGIKKGSLSLVVVDDPTIHELNRRYLQHDYPTDVLSFTLDSGPAGLEGEVIVSADTAAATAEQYGWSAADELLLYVIHGTLHLTGHDDATPELLAAMRQRERQYLEPWGLRPRYDAGEMG